MKRLLKISIIIIAALLVLAVILYQTGTFRSGMISPGEKTVSAEESKGKVFKLVPTTVPVYYKTVGTIRSRDEIELSPRIIARITDITKRSGDSIKKDEILIKLDDSDLVAAELQASEKLKAAEAVQEWAEKNYRRQKTLLEKKVIPSKTFEQAEEALQTAFAGKKAAQQAMRQAQANLSFATIKSPMDGIISDRLNDPGDLASPGNIIMKIFDPKRLMIYVPLRESLVKSVKIDDKIKFYVESLKQSFTGEVREIVPSVDPGSRTFLIKMCILGDTKILMPGMFGTIELQLGTEKAWIVPSEAVTRIGQLEYLHTLKDDKVIKTIVRTVPGTKKGTLKIVSGINSETEIVMPTSQK
jgi:RND family efflux transporter MFP subunit